MRRFPGVFWLVLLAAVPALLAGCAGDEKELIKPQPQCEVTPTALQFGDVVLDVAEEMSFTLRNSGDGVLRGVVSERCDRFDIVSGAGEYGLAAGESIVVTVRFETPDPGEFSCEIDLGGGLWVVPCTAHGVAPLLRGTATANP